MQVNSSSFIRLAAIPLSVAAVSSSLLAATKTYNSTTSSDMTVTTNWTSTGVPVTSNEVLFSTATGSSDPLAVAVGGNYTWGNLIWNNNVTKTIGNPNTTATPRSLTLSGGGGSSEALLAGGATGDLLLMGTNATSNTLAIGPNVSTGTGTLNIVLSTAGNFNVVNSGATLKLTGTLTGAFDLNKTGLGTLILSGSTNNTWGSTGKIFNIYAGTVELDKTGATTAISAININVGDSNSANGTVLVKYTGNSTNQIANTAVVTLYSDATLDLNGASDAIGGLNGAGSVINNTGTLSTLSVGGDIDSEFSGSLTATTPANLALTKSGLGTFTLSGSSSTYSGATTVAGGTLKLAGGSAIPDASSVVFANAAAVLDVNGTTETIGSLAGGGNNVPTVNLGTNGHLTTGGDNTTTTYTGTIQGTNGRLTKTGDGTLTLAGATPNTFTGLTLVSGGKLTLGKSANINAVGGNVTVADGATLNIGAIEQVSDSALITLQAGSTLDFSVISKTETAGLSMNGATIANTGTNGTFILTNIYSFAGNNTIDSSLVLATATTGDVTRTFDIGPSDTLTINGAMKQVTSAASINKAGAGTMILTAPASHTGSTTVSGGVLTIGSAAHINSTSGVTIDGGELRWNSSTALGRPLTFTSGMIGGTGKIGIAVNTGSVGITSPGDGGVGSQEFAAGLDYSAGGTYLWELGAYSTSSGFDQIVLSGGGLTLGGTSKLAVNFTSAISGPDGGNAFWNSDHLWKIIDKAGAGTTGNFVTILNGVYNAGTFGTIIGTGDDAGDVFLTYTVIPEPTSAAVLALGGLALMRRRRRVVC